MLVDFCAPRLICVQLQTKRPALTDPNFKVTFDLSSLSRSLFPPSLPLLLVARFLLSSKLFDSCLIHFICVIVKFSICIVYSFSDKMVKLCIPIRYTFGPVISSIVVAYLPFLSLSLSHPLFISRKTPIVLSISRKWNRKLFCYKYSLHFPFAINFTLFSTLCTDTKCVSEENIVNAISKICIVLQIHPPSRCHSFAHSLSLSLPKVLNLHFHC